MGGRDSRNDVSDMEWLVGLGKPTPDGDDVPREAESEADEDPMLGELADGGGDPLGEFDGLLVLRRLAQEASKPQARFRGLRRRARHDNKHRRVSRESFTPARRDLTVHPEESPGQYAHTPNWCPTVGINILMRADRSCPACGGAV